MANAKISIVVPCYNEQAVLPIFYKTIIPYLEEIDNSFEIIFVDDGSKDETSSLVKDLASNDKRVKYIIFSRNFGKEAAMYAGLSKAAGDYVVVMDADLQDPPEKLKEMYVSIQNEGFDCVATRRVTRKGEPKIRSWFARKFYKLINKMTQTEIVDGARDYRMMNRKMVDAVLSMKEYNRFSKGIFSFVGFKTKWLEYENIQRAAGETKWNFRKLFVYAVEGILAFTLSPLYFVIKLGVFLCGISVLGSLTMLILHLIPSVMFDYSETLILISVLCFLASLIIICLGIVGVYVAKINNEVKNRPIYIEKDSNL